MNRKRPLERDHLAATAADHVDPLVRLEVGAGAGDRIPRVTSKVHVVQDLAADRAEGEVILDDDHP